LPRPVIEISGEVMKSDMELTLPARAENVAVVRHALGAFGEAFGIDPHTLSDVRLAVTEACTNVVVHAYPDRHEGPMVVLASMLADELVVVVRDRGRGIVPRPDSPGLGLGLPLIASLTESVQLGRDDEEHTEVRMTFSLSDAPHHSPHYPLDGGGERQERLTGESSPTGRDR
jgi:serine/threonine-protein kinase RsbW